jgi:D-glycero-alpha-D-manno-heptose-7-phosphate kinase
MIIAQTPLRVSFFGGGTDFRSYFLEEGGCVLSTAIDKYIFVTIKKRFDDQLRVGYTETELVGNLEEVKHELIREALRKTGITSGVEITTMGDIPSAGSGLGSSSTVTVGALRAMYSYLGENGFSAERLAQEACEIEIDVLGKPIGIQDQYIAAYGGFRFIEFAPDGSVRCEKLDLGDDLKQQLTENLLLFYTGQTRKSATILTEQRANIAEKKATLGAMKELAYAARDELVRGNLDSLGLLLHKSWQLKRQLASGISNAAIDRTYETALNAGALGGKITGAGGGGFLLIYVPQDRRRSVRAALNGMRELPIQLESDGAKVIFNYRR